MLAIKLKPVGKKGQKTFRIVVTEKKSKLKGRYAEDLGFFNSHSNSLSVNKEKAALWMKNGAKPTATVYNILVKTGVLKGPKIPVHSKSKKPPVSGQAVEQLAQAPTAEKSESPASELAAPAEAAEQETSE